MPFAAALSTAFPASKAREVARSILHETGQPSWWLAFTSRIMPRMRPSWPSSLGRTWHAVADGHSGESIVGGSREGGQAGPGCVGGRLGRLGEHRCVPPRSEETPDGPTLFGWPDAILEADPANSLLLCFGDPYTFPAVDLFRRE